MRAKRFQADLLNDWAAEEWEEADLLSRLRKRWIPNQYQLEIISDPHLRNLNPCGRSFGKTALLAQFISRFDEPGVTTALSSRDRPTLARTVLREIKARFPDCHIRDNLGQPELKWRRGMTTLLLSGDKKDDAERVLGIKNLLAYGADEPGSYHEAFFPAFYPALTPRTYVFMAGSKIAGGFWQHLCLNVAPKAPDKYSVHDFPSKFGRPPSTPEDEWEEMLAEYKLVLPEAIYERDILNFWGSTEGAVFRHVPEALERGKKHPPLPPEGIPLAPLVDYADVVDYNVFAIGARLGEQRVIWFLDRFNQIGCPETIRRLLAAAADYRSRYRGVGWFNDHTGIGRSHDQLLEEAGESITGINYKGSGGRFPSKKAQMVYNLSFLLDKGKFDIAPTPLAEQGAGELQRYECQPGSSPGNPKYGAPSGLHDDFVSVCLQLTEADKVLETALFIDDGKRRKKSKPADDEEEAEIAPARRPGFYSFKR